MTMRTTAIYRNFYKAALAEVRAERDAYRAAVDDWYENGDGRSPAWETVLEWSWNGEQVERTINMGGKGYRFPHCPHGMSLWTDYDNICGRCEDSMTVHEEASVIARSNFEAFAARWDWFATAPASLPHDVRASILTWVMEPLPKA